MRKHSVAGTFYPNDSKELERYFNHFNSVLRDSKRYDTLKSRSVIVPHAGYIYSGFSANIAYKILKNSELKNVIVIGPSHKIAFNGVSMCQEDSYETPFGVIKSAVDLRKKIQEKFNLQYVKEAHAEHSTETQFPFIKHYLKEVRMIELVYSKESPEHLSEIIDFCLEDESIGIIISTDLSHFYDLEKAKKLDNICLNAIAKLDISMLNQGCEACGKRGVEAMLISAKKENMKANILDYRTSADASKDTSRVVGYASAYFS